MKTAWFSLRRRLLGLLLGGVSACWLLTLAFSYADAHHEVDQLFDAQLAQAGQALLALAGRGSEGPVEDIGGAAHKYQPRLRFQIWDAGGRLLLRSNNAPERPLTERDGFSETRGDDGHWRYFSQWSADRRMQVQVSEDHRIRDDLIEHIAWRLLQPALFGLPLLGLWVWVGTRRGLSALDEVAARIEARSPQQPQSVLPAAAPVEIRPMLEAVNGLLYRVERALESERRFTADAAHELRTPLAALQAQLQVALRARDGGQRDAALGKLQDGLARAARLVDQMLQLARLDPESCLPEAAPVDLGELAAGVCAELGGGILERGLDFELLTAPGIVVAGKAEWLQVLLRNLVDNAVRYTPAGGRLQVAVAWRDGQPCLRIADSGPGIPAGERANVLRRFQRLGRSEQPGSGLGLSIVLRIAELHGARLELGDAEFGGLLAAVTFPAAAA